MLDLADRFHRGPGGHRPVGTAGGADPLEAVNAATNALELDTEEGVVAVESSGLRVLAAAARYHDALNGAICIARAPDAGPWDEDTTTLLEGVGDHLGIAIAQIESHEKLEELSRTDELTGLLNRRAFFSDIEQRLQVLTRRKRRAALFYIDLDNFKQVNDIHGHKRGDEALVALSHILVEGSRIGDLVSRLGGDEFAMWLEETDETAAVHKAEALFGAARALEEYSGGPDHPLGISVGIAVTDPDSREPLKSLIALSDGAMYMIKHGSKGSYAIAEPAASVSEAGA